MTIASPRLSRTLRSLHLWLGLIAGTFIVAMTLSGFVLAYKPALEDHGPDLPASSASAPVNLDAVEQVLGAIHPGAKISRITYPQEPRQPLLVQAEDRDKTRLQLLFDPSNGAILGTRQRRAWLDWIVDLHQNLFYGRTGRSFTGFIGAALLLLSLTGLITSLSGRQDWKRTLALPKFAPWKQAAYPFHRWVGLWSNALLAIVACTGIVLAIPDAVQTAIRAVSGEPQPAPKPAMSRTKGDKSKPRRLAAYVESASKAVPGGALREIRLDGRRDGVSTTWWTPGDIRSKGGTTVTLDAATAEVLSVERFANAGVSRRLVEFANAIHKIELGGWTPRVLWSILGLLPLYLMASGVQIWWTRRQVEARRRAAAAKTSTPALPTPAAP